MKIKTHYSLHEGELLDLHLALGGISIRTQGRTVYSELLPSGEKVSGIQFVELSEGNRLLLNNYLLSLEQWPKKRSMLFTGERATNRGMVRPAMEKEG
jgi:hypothetical protein